MTYGFQNLTIFGSAYPRTLSYPTSKDYIVGIMVEVSLPLHLAVEADALYRPLNFTNATLLADGELRSISAATVVTWEAPVLAKYRFQCPGVKPFLELGPSFRASWNRNSTNPSTHGLTAGVGVEAHFWKLKIAPAIRYTRWAPDEKPLGLGFTHQDQVELLAEFSF